MVYSNKLLIFLHIPKTGGQTLTNIVLRQYPKNTLFDFSKLGGLSAEFVLKIKEEVIQSDCLWGHFLFGIHNYIPKPFTYISMMRDPVEQVISNFFSSYRHPTHPERSIFLSMSFEDYLNNDNYLFTTSNFQTRFLCGSSVKPDLQLAKDNINKYFSIVGLTEQFSESIYLMKKELSWGDIQIEKFNVNPNRPKKKDFPKDLIDKIIEKNQLDIELYEYVKRELDKKIESLDLNSRKELEAYKKS